MYPVRDKPSFTTQPRGIFYVGSKKKKISSPPLRHELVRPHNDVVHRYVVAKGHGGVREGGPVHEGGAHHLEGLPLANHGVDADYAALVLAVDLGRGKAAVRGDGHPAYEVVREDLLVLLPIRLMRRPVGEQLQQELRV